MNTIPYKIEEIIIDGFQLNTENLVEKDTIKLSTEFRFIANFEFHKIRCISMYEYFHDKHVIMRLDLICTFDVEESAFEGMRSNGNLTIKTDFLRYMATISVGAARGIIVAKSENIIVKNMILPPINLVEIIEEDAIINE